MDTILGLFGMLLWIAAVMGLAAAITYAVIKLSPGEKAAKQPEQDAGKAS
jgi:hypothetical protein